MKILRKLSKNRVYFYPAIPTFILLIKLYLQGTNVTSLREKLNRISIIEWTNNLCSMDTLLLESKRTYLRHDTQAEFYDPLLRFPLHFQRTKQENLSLMSIYYQKGPTKVVWKSHKTKTNVSFILPENVSLRRFSWNIPPNEPVKNKKCEKSHDGELEVPLIPEAITKDWLLKFHPPYVGGIWNPGNCIARDRVAILVPYRRRSANLHIFLPHMHQFL
jgi:hypothetical protein